MKLPHRLSIGLVGVGLLTLACSIGPLLHSPMPADPVHAALIPPMTRVTALTLDDGRVLVAPHVHMSDGTVVVDSELRRSEFADGRVLSRSRHRFWLGSDRFGRDVLWQMLVGGRISLLIAALSAALALGVGSVVGVAAATGGRLADSALMRLVDAFLAFPVLFLMILAAALFRPGPMALVVLLGFTSWMGAARLVRGQVLSLRTRPFILAARASGSRWHRILAMHYLPNLVGPLSQDTAMRMGNLVIAEATLSYLGLGVPPSVPTWGSMVAEGHRVMLDGWWLATAPGLAIACLVISLALIGDGLQQLGEASA